MHGFEFFKSFLTDEEQFELTGLLRKAITIAPFVAPVDRAGLDYPVLVSNIGSIGWTSNFEKGIHYSQTQENGRPWPIMPDLVMDITNRLAGEAFQPDNGQISLYQHPGDRDGIHRDQYEEQVDSPIVIVGLGDTMFFEMGGPKRVDPIKKHIFRSGDAIVLSGQARMAWHGTNELMEESCALPLFKKGGHISLTVREVNIKT